MSKLRFIGITGGIGAGKSELLQYIKRHYRCEIYLADEVAHQLQEPGSKCFEALKMLLGEDVVGEDGRIDKGSMAERIFRDQELLAQVNDIIHPAVREYLLERFTRAKDDSALELFFVEAALLVEAGYKELVDEMWYIYADRDVRADRLRGSRGYEQEKIDRIMRRQLSEEDFREACDFIIDNSGSLEDSYRQIDKKLEAFTWQE